MEKKSSLMAKSEAHSCNSSYLGGRDRRIMVQSQPGQKLTTLSEKQTKSKRTEGMALVEELLPSKVKVMSSNPSATKHKSNLKKQVCNQKTQAPKGILLWNFTRRK
jgi:hypothetical protein